MRYLDPPEPDKQPRLVTTTTNTHGTASETAACTDIEYATNNITALRGRVSTPHCLAQDILPNPIAAAQQCDPLHVALYERH
jgi:hypothetical protein